MPASASVLLQRRNLFCCFSSFTDDTALALGRHAGDDTALALADQLLAISSRQGAVTRTRMHAKLLPYFFFLFDRALRSRLFEYACRGLREALRDILDDVGSGGRGERAARPWQRRRRQRGASGSP